MEQWKDISGYEGLYQVSDLGNVKSLSRFARVGGGGFRLVKERMLKGCRQDIYLGVSLSKGDQKKNFPIHHLVWDAFGDGVRDGKRLEVDHINQIDTDNRIVNLQLLTTRANVSKAYLNKEGKSSQFTGVCWSRRWKRWIASITINKRIKHLGSYRLESDAGQAYQRALSSL